MIDYHILIIKDTLIKYETKMMKNRGVKDEKKAYYPNPKSYEKLKFLDEKIVVLKSICIPKISARVLTKGSEVVK